RAEQLRVRINERRPVAFEQFSGRKRPIELGKLGLVIEQLQVARCTGHEQKDDILRPRSNWRPLERKWVRCRLRRLNTGQLTECDRPQANATFLQEPAPSERLRRNVAV